MPHTVSLKGYNKIEAEGPCQSYAGGSLQPHRSEEPLRVLMRGMK